MRVSHLSVPRRVRYRRGWPGTQQLGVRYTQSVARRPRPRPRRPAASQSGTPSCRQRRRRCAAGPDTAPVAIARSSGAEFSSMHSAAVCQQLCNRHLFALLSSSSLSSFCHRCRRCCHCRHCCCRCCGRSCCIVLPWEGWDGRGRDGRGWDGRGWAGRGVKRKVKHGGESETYCGSLRETNHYSMSACNRSKQIRNMRQWRSNVAVRVAPASATCAYHSAMQRNNQRHTTAVLS